MEKDDQNNDVEQGRESRKSFPRQDAFQRESYQGKPDDEKKPQKRSDDEDNETRKSESSQRFQDSNKGGILEDVNDKDETISMTQIGVPTEKSMEERAEDKDDGVEDPPSKLAMELQNHIQEPGMGGTDLKFLIQRTHEDSHLPVLILTEEEERTFSEEAKEVEEVVRPSLARSRINFKKRKTWTNVVQRNALREGGEGGEGGGGGEGNENNILFDI